eukprot:CAMPEP_0173203190 /NCGR_PEP_ID=MMETSP1141-20130122/19384_1 /TAXON_ID=483371 /ORGANISM="non described non described, Strain CCMP2298" /LENGTH=364 /DNA_ID=CAMNT_0014128625 /DNA_START=44 /DNA_END=1135 /DNA_ORIENTATION=+
MSSAAAGVAKIDVSYQGQVGSFTRAGAVNFFSRCPADSVQFSPAQGLKDVFVEVTEGRSAYGVVPLESSSHGTIHSVYDMLLASGGKVFIVGEIGQLEEHCLCMNNRSTVKESDITKVYCHPHILDCCSEYLDALDSQRQGTGKPPLQRIPTWDSAAACTLVGSADSQDLSASAIGSSDAAQFHAMKMVKRGVGNDSNAETRYVVLARRISGSADGITDTVTGTIHDPLQIAPVSPVAGGTPTAASNLQNRVAQKASIALGLRNESGALFKMSSCFALRNVNIVKIESRPSSVASKMRFSSVEQSPFAAGVKHWDLIYYIDYECGSAETQSALLSNLQEYCLWIRQLGHYAPGLHAIEAAPSEW